MKMLLYLIISVAIVLAENVIDNFGDLPMQNPDLFEGDVLGFGDEMRNAITQDDLRWPKGEVIYIIDPSLKSRSQNILDAMDDFQRKTCIKFKERTKEKDYIRIFAGQGCNSYVGRIGGEQNLSLGKGCIKKALIIHQLCHALGFYHEHNRSDRDDYIEIVWDNIMTGMTSFFQLYSSSHNKLLDKFDYNSIMMHGERIYSKNGKSKTIIPKQEGVKLLDVYQKPGLSKSDILRIKKLYQCEE